MSARRLLAYGAVGALLALPGLVLLVVTAAGLVLSVVVVGVPLLLGGLVLVSAMARFDRWLVTRLVGLTIDDAEPGFAGRWNRAGLVRVTRDAAFVLARSAVGLGALALCVAAVTASIAGLGAFTVDGFLANGQWRSTAGASSWWGPLVTLGALVAGAAVLVVAGLLQTTLAGLLGPTESLRLERARHHQVAADERSRIAADLHDAVGHSLTVTTLQAAAAARVVRTDPDFVAQALHQIETDSRRALAEVDRALALLSGSAATAPPDTRQLSGLLDALRTAGMSVTDEVVLPDALADDLSQAVYRIVQEAGTNALRHSSDGKLIVSVTSDQRALAVRIVSTGSSMDGRPTLGPGGGRGLDGLRARCEALGGSLSAGPNNDGGSWVVTASLPVGGGQA